MVKCDSRRGRGSGSGKETGNAEKGSSTGTQQAAKAEEIRNLYPVIWFGGGVRTFQSPTTLLSLTRYQILPCLVTVPVPRSIANLIPHRHRRTVCSTVTSPWRPSFLYCSVPFPVRDHCFRPWTARDSDLLTHARRVSLDCVGIPSLLPQFLYSCS